MIIGKFLLKTKDDIIFGLGFQGIWLYTPKNTNGLNILLLGHANLKMATAYVQNVSKQTDSVIENSRRYVI